MNVPKTRLCSLFRSLLRMPAPHVLLRQAVVSGLLIASLYIPKAEAYTLVQVSSTAPAGLEASFLAATTSQFSGSLVTNPFFPNTYQILLQNINPNFNPAPKMQDLINNLVTVDSWTYVAGWANGESYQQSVDVNTANNFTAWCSSAPYFGLVTIDSTTCVTVAASLAASIFQLQLSTPTTVPGNFQ